MAAGSGGLKVIPMTIGLAARTVAAAALQVTVEAAVILPIMVVEGLGIAPARALARPLLVVHDLARVLVHAHAHHVVAHAPHADAATVHAAVAVVEALVIAVVSATAVTVVAIVIAEAEKKVDREARAKNR